MGAGMQRDANLDLAVIGNCTWAGLVDDRARLVWGCLPRFDSDPVFPALVDGAIGDEGVFAIDLLDFARSERHYDGNTAILRTILTDDHGSAVEILDFAPRFAQFGRTYRPTMMMRRVCTHTHTHTASSASEQNLASLEGICITSAVGRARQAAPTVPMAPANASPPSRSDTSRR